MSLFTNTPLRRCGWLLLSILLMVSTAGAAEQSKIIYVRPVPQNDDALLSQGTTGIRQAALLYQLQASTLESQPTRAGRQQQLDNAVKQGAKIVVMIGYEFRELLDSTARAAPQTRFVILEHCLDKSPPNLLCISFRETEASYLAGMEAALSSSNARIGMIGAVDTALRRKNAEAFIAGAHAASPTVTIHNTLWVDGAQPFNDPARAEVLAKTMLADGVDVIFADAGAGNAGVFKALASQPKAKAIGSGTDQCSQLTGRILDNVEVHADTAIALAVAAIVNGSTATRFDVGLKEGAVSLTGLGLDAAYSDCAILRQRPVTLKLRDAGNAIMHGKLKVD